MKAVGRFIVVSEIKESYKSSGGLLLTSEDTNGMRYRQGKVVTSGSLVDFLKPGDDIFYNKLTTHEVLINKELYTVVEAKDVVAVL